MQEDGTGLVRLTGESGSMVDSRGHPTDARLRSRGRSPGETILFSIRADGIGHGAPERPASAASVSSLVRCDCPE